MASNSDSLTSIHPPNSFTPSNIIVGNGSLLAVTSTGTLSFFTLNHPLYLHNILISPEIIKTLIYVRRFTTEDHCSVEFDPFGLSVKDLTTRNVIVRCNSSRELYSFRPPTQAHLLAATTSSTVLWHRRLGHLGQESLSCLGPSLNSVCNISELEILCHACQLGRHVCLPFTKSNSRALKNFDLIHCDLWTSPVASITSYKYYLIILDDCSHHSWTFSLRLKSDTFPTLSIFSLMSLLSLAPWLSPSNATTVGSSTTPLHAPSSSLMVPPFGCHVLIPPFKMVALNASFVLLTTSCILSCFRLVSWRPIGQKPFTLRPTS
jgi:hypothetical protein